MQRRPRLWLILAAPCLLFTVVFVAIQNYFYAAIGAVVVAALLMRAWEERNPPDE